MNKIYEVPDQTITIEDIFTEMDEVIKDFFREHEGIQATILKCNICGLSYRSDLDHRCRYRRD